MTIGWRISDRYSNGICMGIILYSYLFRRFEHVKYRQALGIAIETKMLDVFERAVAMVCDMLSYAFLVVMSLIQSRDFRSQVVRTLVRLYRALSTPDYVQMCQCMTFLD